MGHFKFSFPSLIITNLIVFLFFLNPLFVCSQTQQDYVELTTSSLESPFLLGTTPYRFNTLYGESGNGNLYAIDKITGSSTYIGSIGYTVTDISFKKQQLYGVTFSQLLKIDPTTGKGTFIGNIGFDGVNALATAPNGELYAATTNGELLKINSINGIGTLVGKFNHNYLSNGDLAFREDGTLFAALTDTYMGSSSLLATIDLNSGEATLIGNIGYSSVFGLSFLDGVLYGVSNSGYVISIDTITGKGKQIAKGSVYFYGLSTSLKDLDGYIISPIDNFITGPTPLKIIAEASYAGGSVKEVIFFVFYDGTWHQEAIVNTPPYQIEWYFPTNVRSQQIQIKIDIIGDDGRRLFTAGGIRKVNLIQSYGNDMIIENWVPVRAYLNQRSLSPDGDVKCSVSCMAMVLSMEGVISNDYQTMATKANEMYPQVLIKEGIYKGIASISKMRDVLKLQGPKAEIFGPISIINAWEKIRSEIDFARPVIVRTKHGVVTQYGHFIVAVGYREEGNRREIIAYDPFGEWRGNCCKNNYNLNDPGNPNSQRGRWVFYDFEKLFGDYLITSIPEFINSESNLFVPLTLPDSKSGEIENIGTYEGIQEKIENNLYLPIIIKLSLLYELRAEIIQPLHSSPHYYPLKLEDNRKR